MAGLVSGLFCAPLSRERCATGRWLPCAQTSPLSLLSPPAGSALVSAFPESTETHPLPGGSVASLLGGAPVGLGGRLCVPSRVLFLILVSVGIDVTSSSSVCLWHMQMFPRNL